MKSLISVNNKFMDITPNELISLINDSKYTKGIEMYIDYKNEKERDYLRDIVYECQKNNLDFQLHGEINLSIDDNIAFLKQLESYSDLLGYPIVVTMHTIYDEDESKSINKTIEYIEKLKKEINTGKIIIALENLNDAIGFIRLDKKDITNMILNDEEIFFTYDIGHEIMDYGNIIDLNPFLIEKIKNVHLHTNDNKGSDHKPIYKNDLHLNEITKALVFLRLNKYTGNIVYEYGLEFCYGNDVREKIIDYLNSIDFVSERYSD